MTDFESELRSEVANLGSRLGKSDDKAFMVWYARTAFHLDDQGAIEAASYDGGNDRSVDVFYIDDEVERAVIAQTKYVRNSQKAPKPGELALLFRVLDELADPQELRNAGRADLAEAADALQEARDREYTVQLHFVYPGPPKPKPRRDPHAVMPEGTGVN